MVLCIEDTVLYMVLAYAQLTLAGRHLSPGTVPVPHELEGERMGAKDESLPCGLGA
jgi:hypothetical protein